MKIDQRVIHPTMKKLSLFLAVSSLLFFAGHTLFAPSKKDVKNNPEAAKALLKLPVSFIENQGQLDSKYPFYAQGAGYQFLFSKQGITYAFPGKQSVIQMTFEGANLPTSIEGAQEQEGKINYLMGKDQSQWKTNIPTFGKVVYRDLYSGIDYQVVKI